MILSGNILVVISIGKFEREVWTMFQLMSIVDTGCDVYNKMMKRR